MTPYELNLHFIEFVEKTERETEYQLYLVYAGERMHRWEKLPEFEQIIKKAAPKKPQSDEDMLAEIKKLNAAFGGTTS